MISIFFLLIVIFAPLWFVCLLVDNRFYDFPAHGDVGKTVNISVAANFADAIRHSPSCPDAV
jgi:hypothetical protein